jgi:hypothetical protein
MKETKTMWKPSRALWILVLGVLALGLGPAGCKKNNQEPAPQPSPTPVAQDPAAAAKKKILDSLIIPPGAELKDTEVREFDLQFSFLSKQPVDSLNLFFNDQVIAKGYTIVLNNQAGINYVDKEGRRINVSWFTKDPDIYKGYQSSIVIAVQPLPPELRPK